MVPSCGRTALGRAAQLGHLAIVCLLLDAEKFYTTPEEEDVHPETLFNCVSPGAGGATQGSGTSLFPTTRSQDPSTPTPTSPSPLSPSGLHPGMGTTLRSPQPHKCCSPSVDSETCTCSDEVRECIFIVLFSIATHKEGVYQIMLCLSVINFLSCLFLSNNSQLNMFQLDRV